ncbi:cation transport regulator ChaB [Candidatus Woesearchaeota archaeon]|nr:cation transport regulator ChaB [Candidatus Woesearchaeota archaeon]
MPYKTIRQLPDKVKDNLPKEAQRIYKEAFNNAWDQYNDPDKRKGSSSRESAANKVAWSAVKKKYKKNKSGNWVKK